VASFSFRSLIFACAVYLVVAQSGTVVFALMVALATLFGFLLVIPIGAADMPVVLALLNSYGGLADAMMGFVLMNNIQIITGSLDGTSGFLLSLLMCRAMNRNFLSVIAGDDLVEGPYTVSQVAAVVAAFKQALQQGRLTMARINLSVERILMMKVQFGIIKL